MDAQKLFSNPLSRSMEISRCSAEIASAEAELRAGNRNVEGLMLCKADWEGEMRLIEAEGRE